MLECNGRCRWDQVPKHAWAGMNGYINYILFHVPARFLGMGGVPNFEDKRVNVTLPKGHRFVTLYLIKFAQVIFIRLHGVGDWFCFLVVRLTYELKKQENPKYGQDTPENGKYSYTVCSAKGS